MYSNVCQSDNSTPFLARHVGHLAGLKPTVPALTFNRYVQSTIQRYPVSGSQTGDASLVPRTRNTGGVRRSRDYVSSTNAERTGSSPARNTFNALDRELIILRLCGSGFQAVITAAQTIALGEANVCLTGGAESMSGSPFTLSGATR